MAPLKFEDNIQDKLEERTIKPSNNSWEKLEQQLDSSHHKNSRKKYWWLGVAASIVGFMITTTMLVTTNDSEFIDVKIVDINEEIIKKEIPVDKTPTKIVEEESVPNIDNQNLKKVTSPTSVVVVENDKKEKNRKETIKKEEQIVFKGIQENSFNTPENRVLDAIASRVDTINSIEKKDKLLEIDATVIDSKIAGVMSKVQELERDNGIVADADIDALLRKAQSEITTQQILKSNKVDVSALLLDVERELDESFKNRVYESLKAVFDKLKTAVAERDN